MEVTAKLRFLRIAPRKVRLVANLIRSKTVQQAEAQLAFLPKRSARPIDKLLHSAIANAENNFKLKKDNLFIKKITVDEGPRLKRWRPRAFGRAAPIIKRSSHINMVLDEVKAHPAKGKKALPTKIQKTAAKKPEIKKEEARPVVNFNEVKHEAKGKNEESNKPEDQKKKPLLSFKNIKDRFTRRTGER
jgi:large subunit ribosomal protein L22